MAGRGFLGGTSRQVQLWREKERTQCSFSFFTVNMTDNALQKNLLGITERGKVMGQGKAQ